MDKRTSMGVIGDLNKYTQFQAAQSMEKAAENPGGAGAAGMGMGMGFAMANQMGQMFTNQQQPAGGGGSPPPLPGAGEWYAAIDGQQSGPFDRAKLSDGARAGKLTRDTLVWKKGMTQWTKAGDVPEIADLLGEIPPPLPPRS